VDLLWARVLKEPMCSAVRSVQQPELVSGVSTETFEIP